MKSSIVPLSFGVLALAMGCSGGFTELGEGTGGMGASSGMASTSGVGGLGTGGSTASGTGGSTASGGTAAASGTGGTEGYEPCAGKECGSACTVCDPNASDCVEPGYTTRCDADGACAPGEIKCSTTHACTQRIDCNLSGPLAKTTCASGVTIGTRPGCDGFCEYVFPACPGECGSDSDCPGPTQACQECADGSFRCPSVRCDDGRCTEQLASCG